MCAAADATGDNPLYRLRDDFAGIGIMGRRSVGLRSKSHHVDKMDRITNAVIHFAQLLATIFGAALAMMAWSEFVFFNEDLALRMLAALERGLLPTLSYIVELGLFYALPGMFIVGLIGLCGSLGSARVMLIGALTGYAIEGAVVPAVYEAVPFSYLWTSIAWHGPVTVGLGVFLMPFVLARASIWAMGGVAIALGVAWGLWMPWTWGAEGMTPVPANAFATYTVMTTATMLVGYGLLRLGAWPAVQHPRWLSVILIVPILLLFAVQGSLVPIGAAGLFVILIGMAALLRWLGVARADPLPLKWQNLVVVWLMPVVAAIVYGTVLETGPLLMTEDLVALGCLGGLAIWIWGVVRGVRRARA